MLRTQTNNRLLDSIEDDSFARLWPDLRDTEVELGEIIGRAEESITKVYFPTASLISVALNSACGETAQTAIIGQEGMSGFEIFLGAASTFSDMAGQIAGKAISVKKDAMLLEFNRGGSFHQTIMLYVTRLMHERNQTAFCNLRHTCEKRLARLLLAVHDSLGSKTLILTHENLAKMIGSNRPIVTNAAINLNKAGAISYCRGRITIANLNELKRRSCNCYRSQDICDPM